jgi:hypothetical protein
MSPSRRDWNVWGRERTGESSRPGPTERIYKEELLPLEDVAEGAAAFLEKRRPEWKHR